jgi:hypothetical protein
MASEQRAELIGRHADAGQDLAQGALGNVLARVDRHGNHEAVRMAHEVVAALDASDDESGAFQRPNDLYARYRRDGARHKAVRYYKSGHVECQSHLVGWPNLFDQKFQSLA